MPSSTIQPRKVTGHRIDTAYLSPQDAGKKIVSFPGGDETQCPLMALAGAALTEMATCESHHAEWLGDAG
jgi:hypothetical protein